MTKPCAASAFSTSFLPINPALTRPPLRLGCASTLRRSARPLPYASVSARSNSSAFLPVLCFIALRVTRCDAPASSRVPQQSADACGCDSAARPLCRSRSTATSKKGCSSSSLASQSFEWSEETRAPGALSGCQARATVACAGARPLKVEDMERGGGREELSDGKRSGEVQKGL